MMDENETKILFVFFTLLSLLLCCQKMDNKMEYIKYYYWIQKSDYSTFEKENINLDQSIKIFNDYNWKNELSNYKVDDENYNCLPGIGFHNGFGKGNKNATLLHICVIDDKFVLFNFHYLLIKKIFYIFESKKIKIFYKDKYPIDKVEILLKYYFSNKYNEILEI